MLRLAKNLLKLANNLDNKLEYQISDKLTRIANRIIQAQYNPAATAPVDPYYGLRKQWQGQGSQFGQPVQPTTPTQPVAPATAAPAAPTTPVVPTLDTSQPPAAQSAANDPNVYYNTGLNSNTGAQQGSTKRNELTMATENDNIKQMVSVLKRNPNFNANQLSDVMVNQAIRFRNSGQFQDWLRYYITNNFDDLKAKAGVGGQTPGAAPTQATTPAAATPAAASAATTPAATPAKPANSHVAINNSFTPSQVFGDKGMNGYLSTTQVGYSDYLTPKSQKLLEQRVAQWKDLWDNWSNYGTRERRQKIMTLGFENGMLPRGARSILPHMEDYLASHKNPGTNPTENTG